MKRLYLLRHAKSSWDRPELDDFDRPLAPRGVRAAPRMGEYMRARQYRPAIALCSPALRARQTWTHVRDALDCRTIERMRPELYDAEPTALLEAVRSVDSRYGSAIVIAHNPGIQELAAALAGGGATIDAYPTAALAVFDVGDWADVRPGEGVLLEFVRPRDLR